MVMFGYYLWGDKEAFAETFEYSGSFPTPENVDPDKIQVMKGIVQVDDTTFEFHIHYKYTAEQVQEWYQSLIEKNSLIQFPDCEFGYDEVTEECLDEIIIESNFIPEKKDALLTQYEKDLERFEEEIDEGRVLSASQTDYYEKLLLLGECYRGQELTPAYGIQENTKYTVAEIWVDPFSPTAFDYTGSHAKLSKAIEECKAQIRYLLPTLGAEALNKGAFHDSIQPYHADFANTDDWETVPNQETYSPAVTAHDMFKEDQRAFEIMCSMDRVSDKYKKQQGCPQPEFEMGTVTSGSIRVNADPMYKLAQYKIDQGEQQLAELLMQQRLDSETQARIVQESHDGN